jgi:hypothetical protein
MFKQLMVVFVTLVLSTSAMAGVTSDGRVQFTFKTEYRYGIAAYADVDFQDLTLAVGETQVMKYNITPEKYSVVFEVSAVPSDLDPALWHFSLIRKDKFDGEFVGQPLNLDFDLKLGVEHVLVSKRQLEGMQRTYRISVKF